MLVHDVTAANDNETGHIRHARFDPLFGVHEKPGIDFLIGRRVDLPAFGRPVSPFDWQALKRKSRFRYGCQNRGQKQGTATDRHC